MADRIRTMSAGTFSGFESRISQRAASSIRTMTMEMAVYRILMVAAKTLMLVRDKPERICQRMTMPAFEVGTRRAAYTTIVSTLMGQ